MSLPLDLWLAADVRRRGHGGRLAAVLLAAWVS